MTTKTTFDHKNLVVPKTTFNHQIFVMIEKWPEFGHWINGGD
jgi:hypothetical protein